MGTLFIIGTPIGNLGDLSSRAAELLRSVDLLVAEDTRVTRKLLNHLDASTPCISYHEHSNPAQLERVLTALESGDVGQVTDAGSPTVSDPGASLVVAAVARGHEVVAAPGPSAITTALSIAGMPGDRFLFLGFLPRKGSERRAVLAGAAHEAGTVVAFETPQRVLSAFEDIASTLGDRQIAVCREMTKLHEEVFRGTATEAAAHFSIARPRGEFVLVIEGAPEQATEISKETIVESIKMLGVDGLSGRSLVEAVVNATGAQRRRVYRLVTESQAGHADDS
ncbi:MAG TPA: 16S rRNA (cytidine(1402)-2'-O)-methyltransferase [Dehalococcoidia bacterium]|jgi:16S rRNA (cytidine1402-2'-O)-methyltransferase|nr:16S rRNA (cytidine(1402)-2'-O)-methyltransferase [Chloroflexota bacterium]MDP5877423.1 16S rRNA (cytidine(1402)-2'-O)-methyltransferase [Dehalococcoidia bacterium]MDP6272474.1 16S rRNA (cytidine(1402)-2'-O)-methyltransferase [Dehalococcoidia bacterium]MDP7161123.1 16S rRNA (cytidine(1402)-2'-O)-methyltransferase [Dehalococcoidia bacterium]MDP7213081.1 16S rRNA (cytidine(1402)-2'-O)-methyltransferase [Dehalococcoidia bacterium]|tara:strand:- start:2784 stop:3626 length:843 start_codon:yes stop_codon:yes gene_type:complete